MARGRKDRGKISGNRHRGAEIFAFCRTYEELIAALQAWRVKRLRISGEALDHLAGFSERYTSKLEIGYRPHGRGVGNMSLPIWLEALGVELAVVPRRESRCVADPAASRKIRDR